MSPTHDDWVFFVIITLVGTVVAFVGIYSGDLCDDQVLSRGSFLVFPTMLFYSKVKKPGMLLIMAVISGAFSLLMP